MDNNDIDSTVALLLSVMQAEDRESRFLEFVAQAENDAIGSLVTHLNRVHPECEDWESVIAAQIPMVLNEFPKEHVTDKVVSLRGESQHRPKLKLGQIQFQPLAAALAQRHVEGWTGFDEAIANPLGKSDYPDPIILPSPSVFSPLRLFETSVIAWKTNTEVDEQTEQPARTIYELKRDILRTRLAKRVAFHFKEFDLDFPTLRGRGKWVTGLRRIERVTRSPGRSGYGLGCRTLRCI